MSFDPPYYPIIYIRGFAATMSEIEETVATPYMGFNSGSTKIKQDHRGDILRFIFESPLIRFMKDEDYKDTYMDGDLIPPGHEVPPKSIWIFRYYEPVSEDLGEGDRREIPRFAADLRDFIVNTVRDRVCGDDAEARRQFKVYLVAHSMGGLIARCYLQNICVNGLSPEDQEEFGYTSEELELTDPPADPLVDKVFTYGTPHNGIDFKGVNVPNLGGLDKFHVRNFNRKVMREYLDLPEDTDRVDSLNGRFPTERFFSFVGTNFRDYEAFFGLSKKVTGEMSDGLVMIRNAVVKNSPRAFAYRSHSGHYGLVNSEEGYQNLRRFLFGQTKVDATLVVDEITLPPRVQKEKDEGKPIRASYHIETAARVRKASYFLHERRVHQNSAIHAKYDAIVKEQKPVYLFSGFLYSKEQAQNVEDQSLAFSINLGIQVPIYEIDRRLWFDGYYEGSYIFEDEVTFHVYPEENRAEYGLRSEDGFGNTHPPDEEELEVDEDREITRLSIPLGFDAGMENPPRPGFRGKLLLEVSPWNSHEQDSHMV